MPNATIIGAGVAGTSAAEQLVAEGWQVTVLEKAARPGGRCATRQVVPDPDSAWFDYGAQYFTAYDPVFRTEVMADLAAGHLSRWQAEICTAERVAGRWQRALSPDERERLVGPRGLNHWIGSRLAACTIEVRCNLRVSALVPGERGWLVYLAGARDPLPADVVVLTVPARQAAALLGATAARIPVLATAEHAMRACHSVVVKAPALTGCQGAFVKHGALSWFADNTHKAGQEGAARHVWTLHASPEFSDAQIDKTAADVAPTLIDEFAAITDLDPATIELAHTHRWRYARPGDGAPAPEKGCYVDGQRRLALAGDWLAGGRVEGAWCSGRAAALGLQDALQSG